MSVHVEAEVKYQISESDYAEFPELMLQFGFTDIGIAQQEDTYVSYEPSVLGGFDFERIRKTVSDVGQVGYSWDRKYSAKDDAGKKVRLEDSRVTSQNEYSESLALASADCPVVYKKRRNFTGLVGDWPATVSLDQVNFGSGEEYFIEAEVITDPQHGREVRKLCKEWLSHALGIDTTQEAPGYLKQYFASMQE